MIDTVTTHQAEEDIRNETVLVWVDLASGRPARLPEAIRDRLGA